MHVSIADDLKKRFHAACALRGLKMSQVITELVEQWLKNTEDSPSSKQTEYEENFDIIG
ncbi:MAG: plasmid partition protein ParG [Rhizonema sp. PD38]|nr:plasmid partition protein ParG [Rhizonema sp. PD38]